jgi:hypothetical protein
LRTTFARRRALGERRWVVLRGIVNFLAGAVVGATLALLFAPQSGQEFRAGFLGAVAKEQEKLRAEWQARMAPTDEGPEPAGQDEAPKDEPSEK